MSGDQLYLQYLDGDQSSFDQLLTLYGDSLVLYLNAYLHNWHDSEDLMVEAFARIMVKKPSIRPGNFKAYLYKTARNLAIRFIKKNRRVELFDPDGTEVNLSDDLSLEDSFQELERNRICRLCLERIEPDLREVLWLKYFEGMTYEEAASVMGINRKRVDKLLQRAKKHLRIELEKEGITNAFE